jgi:hypothetical protein
MYPQIPSWPARAQDWHKPEHAVLQQKPSTQLKLWQSVARVQAVPLESSVQPPAPLHVLAPEHSSAGSWPFGMYPQVPSWPARAQDWHKPEHAVLQQKPSTQLPPWQSGGSMQVADCAHAPAPLQAVLPAHSFAGS